jgi:predicted AAA+ superfamily ATPase
VGKSFLIEQFAEDHFDSSITINLEQKPELSAIFNSLDPKQIISQIGLHTGRPVEPGKTLLFIDEIQKNPRAIMALRYFHEQMPELHVVAAGSLLEFALEAENFSFPVGRIESLFLPPLSFLEFLEALGKGLLAELIRNGGFKSVAPAIHDELNRLVRQYLAVGGMPEAVRTYAESGDLSRVTRVHESIIQNFRDDFGKYARLARHADHAQERRAGRRKISIPPGGRGTQDPGTETSLEPSGKGRCTSPGIPDLQRPAAPGGRPKGKPL